MKKIIEFLEKLEFSKTETKLYITLLQKGSMTVSELAEKVKLNRTAIYGYINKLLEKGVISRSKGNSNKIIANPPERLHFLVDEKVSSVHLLQEQLFPVVTALNSSFMQSLDSDKSDVKYFKGKAGVKAIYEDCLKATEIRAYYNPTEIQRYFPENILIFSNTLKRNPKMKVYELVQDSPATRHHIAVSKFTGRHVFKFFPPDVRLTSNDILIYEGKVAVINLLGPDNFNGFILQNRDYFNNSKQIYDLLWRLIPEPKTSLAE